jgi:hypothetical protein
MALTMQVVSLLCLSSALSFAETVSGFLVNSKCYAAEERNVNPADTETYVDRDGNLEIRHCRPRAKTKAAELVRQSGKKSRYDVAVVGGISKHTIQVESISLAR